MAGPTSFDPTRTGNPGWDDYSASRGDQDSFWDKVGDTAAKVGKFALKAGIFIAGVSVIAAGFALGVGIPAAGIVFSCVLIDSAVRVGTLLVGIICLVASKTLLIPLGALVGYGGFMFGMEILDEV